MWICEQVFVHKNNENIARMAQTVRSAAKAGSGPHTEKKGSYLGSLLLGFQDAFEDG